MNDCIEKTVELKAPVSRVWRALVDHREFGEWFRVKLDAPFEVGKVAIGRITHPGYEHVVWRATVTAIEPERRFAFTWHPYAIDETVDYDSEPPTLVEFTLEPTATGTLLRVSETGFDGIPAGRRAEAFRMNEGGWTQQVENIRRHVESGCAESAGGR